jgi:diguanylate cyclase (GGDEF)-like protein
MTPAPTFAAVPHATDASAAAAHDIRPRWYQSLQFKLLLAMMMTAVAVAAGAGWLVAHQVDARLTTGSLALEQAVHRQLEGTLTGITENVKTLATTLENLHSDARTPAASLRASIPLLVAKLPDADLIAAVGIWPEPASAGAERNSSFWLRDSTGVLTPRDDYNDARTILFSREAWYTPARYVAEGRCYWTPVYVELLSKRQVVTCTLPLTGAHGFEGVATVSLDLEALGRRFAAATADERGYALLLDRDGNALALSASAQKAFGSILGIGRNVATLSQNNEGFAPLTLALHRRASAFEAAALHAPDYNDSSVSTLKDNTREYARVDAQSAITSLLNIAPIAPETLVQSSDPVFGEPSYAVISDLPWTHWQLASVTRATEGAALTRVLIMQSLMVAFAAAALMLLLSLGLVHWLVIRPLQRMAQTIADHGDGDPADLTFEATRHDEIGAVMHWHNERTRHLRDTSDRTRLDRSRIALETAERQRAQEALARLEERSLRTLVNLDDGVIYVDERGQVDQINAAAERITGLLQRDATGQPLATVLPLRLGGQGGATLPNVVDAVMERGTRLDYPGGVFIGDADNAIEIRLAVAALTARNGRRIGCVVVFRPIESAAAAPARLPATMPSTPGFDPITGLGDRGACERLLRKLAGTSYAVAVLNVLRLSEINETAGHSTGDEVLAQIGARLSDGIETRDRVFRLPGDRMAMVIEAVDAEVAAVAFATLREAVVSTPFETAGGRFEVDVAIGFDTDPEVTPGAESLRRAEIACRTARTTSGKLQAWHRGLDPETTATVDDALWIERIRAGLDRDLFHLTTQRIAPTAANAADGEVFEILLALEDEEGFWAPPASFLAVAERHGLNAELDRWVIRRTLEALEAQPATCERLAFVGINLSGLALADSELLDFLAERFSETPPAIVSKLCFELRESDIEDHPQRGQRFCAAMRALGCRVSVDRYQGRSTSEVQMLRHLPAALIKLDSRPYRGIADDEVAQIQAESQLRVLHHIGKRVIVTGIDDERALAIWRRLGADYLQGYAVAKPSPIIFTG